MANTIKAVGVVRVLGVDESGWNVSAYPILWRGRTGDVENFAACRNDVV